MEKIIVKPTKKSNKSNSEQQFEYWLDELIKQGYVLYYEREPETFVLKNNLDFTYTKEIVLKTKTKIENKRVVFLKEIKYTPDYKIVFTEKAKDIYVRELYFYSNWYIEENTYDKYKHFLTTEKDKDNNYTVYVDVKPPSFVTKFASNVASSREFPIKQRLMFDEYHIFVNKVVPIGSKNCLFNKTFKPKKR